MVTGGGKIQLIISNLALLCFLQANAVSGVWNDPGAVENVTPAIFTISLTYPAKASMFTPIGATMKPAADADVLPTNLQDIPIHKYCLEPPLSLRVNGNAVAPCIFYDTVTLQCQVYPKGKCGETRNNFGSYKACENLCMPNQSRHKAEADLIDKVLTDLDVYLGYDGSTAAGRRYANAFCGLEVDHGTICPGIRLSQYLEVFYFDVDLNRCDEFNYNGCGGNANRFSSLWECSRACMRKITHSFK